MLRAIWLLALAFTDSPFVEVIPFSHWIIKLLFRYGKITVWYLCCHTACPFLRSITFILLDWLAPTKHEKLIYVDRINMRSEVFLLLAGLVDESKFFVKVFGISKDFLFKLRDLVFKRPLQLKLVFQGCHLNLSIKLTIVIQINLC